MTLPLLVVSDTSPVSALVVMGWLDWLRQRWSAVHVPERVWDELRQRSRTDDWTMIESARSQGWLRVTQVKDQAAVAALMAGDLDSGECEAIVLAQELRADLLLMDESDGRKAAAERGLTYTGTVGIVLWAKREGMIPSAREALRMLRQNARFFLSDDLIEYVAQEAGEPNLVDEIDALSQRSVAGDENA